MNSKVKTLIAIIIVLAICVGIFILIGNKNNVNAAPSGLPSVLSSSVGYRDDYGNNEYVMGFYCMDKSKAWPTVDAPRVSGGSLSFSDAYYFYNGFTERSSGTESNDNSSYIWGGGNGALSNRASSKANPSIKITSSQGEVVIDQGGSIGTFNIAIPGGSLDAGEQLKVTLNNQDIGSALSYNFSANDPRINYGGTNTISVEYTYWEYYGEYAIYQVPGGRLTLYYSDGYEVEKGSSSVYVSGTWRSISNHSYGTETDEDGTEYYTWVEVDTQRVEGILACRRLKKITQSFSFWAGRPDLNLTLNKKSPGGGSVSASFSTSVTGGRYSGSIPGTIKIKPTPGADNISVTLTETDAGDDYIKYDAPIVLNFTLSGKAWALSSSTFPEGENIQASGISSTASASNCSSSITIDAVDRTTIKLDLTKVIVNPETGAEIQELHDISFSVSVSGGKEKYGVSSMSSGGKLVIEPDKGASSVSVTLTEEASRWYQNIPAITINFSGGASSQTWACTTNSNNTYPSFITITNSGGAVTHVSVKVGNIATIEEPPDEPTPEEPTPKSAVFTLTKVNANCNDEKLPNVEFSYTIENARLQSGGKTGTITTDSEGIAKFDSQIEILDPTKEVIIKLTETGVPSTPKLHYRGLYEGGEITLRITHREGSTYEVSDASKADLVYDVSYNEGGEDNQIRIGVKNLLTMDLSGQVWLDGQTGIKPVQPPDGIRGSEPGMGGIIVRATSSTGKTYTTVTGADGKYEFLDLPASYYGDITYEVEFSYDGINYIAVPKHASGSTEENDSDVDEIDRAAYNSRFETITKGQSNDGTSLEYDHSADGKIATLITTNADGTVLDKFAMNALADSTYNEITEHIDMGLEKKSVDLAAVTEIETVTVSINGKQRIYDKINDSWKTLPSGDVVIEDFQYNDTIYSLYLYDSDYNYRINDYNLEQATEADLAMYNNYADGKNGATLDVTFNYKVLLNNQSTTEATINDIAYYYDSRLIMVDASGNNIDSAVTDTINGVTYKKTILHTNQTLGDGAQAIANLYFKLDTSNNKESLEERPIRNWVEIISYSTNKGCIDEDSAPDDITENQSNPYIEDDSDDAKGIQVNIDITPRVISGYVFEDTGKDGTFDNGTDSIVNGVIVQLIEVQERAGIKLEYIWQETVSGSKGTNNIKCLTTEGTQGAYGHNNNDGEFYFAGFITGNYIVRFIYGDKTYYEYAIGGNPTDATTKAKIEQYNGLYYQSTKDHGYTNVDWDGSYYSATSSMARDNESRRVQQIYNATNPTDASGNAISNIRSLKTTDMKTFLDKTWMCAETSRIQYDPDAAPEVVAKVGERGINFGLAKRPEVKLELVKHITNLEIGDSIRTNAKMDNYYDDLENVIKTELGTRIVKTAEASIREKNKIGKWFVELPVDDINNQKVIITYEYLINDIGDRISIGNKLADVESTQLENIANSIKTEQYKVASNTYKIGDYLGTSYYADVLGTGPLNDNEQEVVLKTKVEDYLSTNANLPQIGATDRFKELESGSPATKNIIQLSGDDGTESVKVIQTTDAIDIAKGMSGKTKQIVSTTTNSTNGKVFTYRSYAARTFVVDKEGKETSITKTGLPIDLPDLPVVYSYRGYNEKFNEMAPEDNHYVAETVEITVNTGGEDPEIISTESNTLRIAEIVAGTMAVIAVGLVLIKKFAIKK